MEALDKLKNKDKRRARLHAVTLLYQHDISELEPEQIIKNYWEESGEEIEEVKSLAEHLFKGTLKKLATVDIEISHRLKKGWTLFRLYPLDRAILREAIYEILFENISPAAAVINDAVEIAKHVGGDRKSPAFINAILDKIAKDKAAGSK